MSEHSIIQKTEIEKIKEKAESIPMPKQKSNTGIDLLSLIDDDEKRKFGKDEYLALVRAKRLHGDKTQIIWTFAKCEFPKRSKK